MEQLPSLELRFAGRVIKHLGIQMYQSPVNAIAELIANAWDADATQVQITLPSDMQGVFVIEDNGKGMTYQECQEHYLNVGRNRREDGPDSTTVEKNRPVLGRKGIGKFAGFGISQIVTVETTSKENGEQTTFQMNLDSLMQEETEATSGMNIPVTSYLPPDNNRKICSGTKITLSDLSIGRTPSPEPFRLSMARRFLIHQSSDEFRVLVNDEPMPEDFESAGVEFIFPGDFLDLPEDVVVDEEGWGVEVVAGNEIRWRFFLHEDTVNEDEMRGVAVFAKKKLAQRPFFFQLAKGFTGQHGTEYLTGQVEASFVDSQKLDLIATERQRINWDRPQTSPLLDWGQLRVKQVLRDWSRLRAQSRIRLIEGRILGFSDRLAKLERHERKTVKKALEAIAKIDTLKKSQLDELGTALLTSWEQGRLRGLIDELAESKGAQPESEILSVLIEAQVLTALQTTEVVRTKLEVVKGLKRRIEQQELENAVRDYIAQNPWLIAPEWETFTRERGLKQIISEAAHTAGLEGDVYRGRVDLALSSGGHLLVLEFMRPGLSVDNDHVDRFIRYLYQISAKVKAETGSQFDKVSGFLVADKIERFIGRSEQFEDLARKGWYVMRWETLLDRAERSWEDFIHILHSRGNDDPRIVDLVGEDSLEK